MLVLLLHGVVRLIEQRQRDLAQVHRFHGEAAVRVGDGREPVAHGATDARGAGAGNEDLQERIGLGYATPFGAGAFRSCAVDVTPNPDPFLVSVSGGQM